MMVPYYADADVTLYHGDCRVVLPMLGTFDCVVTDPPYGETALAWDKWPTGWPTLAAAHTSSLWCFGSLRMFLDRRDEFVAWTLSQDVVWRKPYGTSMRTDRFSRVHEYAVHWYHGPWGDVRHDVPMEGVRRTPQTHFRKGNPPHQANRVDSAATYVDDGRRLMQSVIAAANLHGRGRHPAEKPIAVLDPLIRYACPPGGTVLDPFAGSGSTAEAARLSGRRSVLVEVDERQCEGIARRMSQGFLAASTERNER